MPQPTSSRLSERIRVWSLATQFVLAAYASAEAAPWPNVLSNSDFETNTWMGTSGYNYHSHPIGWYVTNKVGDASIIMSSAVANNPFATPSPTGQKYLTTLQLYRTTSAITLAHDFTTEADAFYTFTCFYTCRWGGLHHAIQVYVDDILIDSFDAVGTTWMERTVETP